MDWLDNPWVVGIGGGILSGLAVTLSSRIILSRKDRGEYVQKLQSANREIVYALRPGISEGLVPERRVVVALINATARKFAIHRGDLHGPDEIREELTKEIMDSSFISAKTKQEYYNQLIALAESPIDREVASIIHKETILESKSLLAEYRSKMTSMMSIILGTMTAFMTMALVLSQGLISGDYEVITSLFLPTIVALSTILLMASMMMLRRERRRSIRKKLQDDSTADSLSKSKFHNLVNDLPNDLKSTRSDEEKM